MNFHILPINTSSWEPEWISVAENQGYFTRIWSYHTSSFVIYLISLSNWFWASFPSNKLGGVKKERLPNATLEPLPKAVFIMTSWPLAKVPFLDKPHLIPFIQQEVPLTCILVRLFNVDDFSQHDGFSQLNDQEDRAMPQRYLRTLTFPVIVYLFGKGKHSKCSILFKCIRHLDGEDRKRGRYSL